MGVDLLLNHVVAHNNVQEESGQTQEEVLEEALWCQGCGGGSGREEKRRSFWVRGRFKMNDMWDGHTFLITTYREAAVEKSDKDLFVIERTSKRTSKLLVLIMVIIIACKCTFLLW